jgi:20S proteasome alpha/beta subunit
MTVCVAALCENGKALVMAADKMVGMGYVEGEPDISKMRPLHRDWWVLFAGDDISPVFDIIDYTKHILHTQHKLGKTEPASLAAVMKALEAGFHKKRLEVAESLYLKTTGWNLNRFNKEGHGVLPNAAQIQADIDRFRFAIELLVVGFDEQGHGCIFSLDGNGDKPGVPTRGDIPGFQSIGSGGTVATFMLYWRHLSSTVSAREALYYVLEAKYYGEQATGVGSSTDLYIGRPGQELTAINDEEVIEKKLIPICRAMEPRDLRKRDKDFLNSMPELEGFPLIKEDPKKPASSKKSDDVSNRP